ncbi:DUF1902 domain-containing protein [Jiella endophytica]|uniref:DUF1902 domain-containing protein n=1 Tax=Jiella endophytica TaxID=2558362 RepID=A0A4Y8RAQ0_9HYPH|nr:DUF1902 domain-containing protein [Jiella endophytica]TFF17943.1 DUF1902 domain-containing protein [Jiella endophytica]
MKDGIVVLAEWDEEAGVWVASSEDVCGLSVESESLDLLQAKVLGALQDLVELNGLRYDGPSIPVHIRTEFSASVSNPRH